MSVPRLLRSLLILVVPAACASEDIPGSAPDLHAAATAACGPADGPAVEIYLAHAPVESLEPPAPFYRIDIWQPLDRLGRRPWSVAPDDGEGGAWFHSATDDFEIAIGGTVTITAVQPDSTVEGVVDLIFPGNASIRGAFRAPWHRRQMLCG